jgi:putative NADH-flavin reductase
MISLKYIWAVLIVIESNIFLSIKVVDCNLLDSNDLAKNFQGHDCILSALGSPGLTLSRITFPLDSMKQIVTAMRSTNLKRIIIVSSQYTKCKNKINYKFYHIK